MEKPSSPQIMKLQGFLKVHVSISSVKCPSKKRHLNFLRRAYKMARGGSKALFQYDVTLFILLAKAKKSQIRFLEERKTFVTLNAQFLF